jgi:CO dehydrogenase maturation factor
LGVEVKESIGQIIDDIAKHPDKVPNGMSKDTFIEYQVNMAIQETEGFDVLAMGKPEGPGCYCYVNNVLRNIVGRLVKDYDYVVVDNEAGLEHLSRRTTRSADALVVVSDATPVGLRAARRISDLVKELEIDAEKKLLIVNRYDKDIEQAKIKNLDLDYIGNIPLDHQIEEASLNGKSLIDIKDDAVSIAALRKMGDKVWS